MSGLITRAVIWR